MYLVLKYAFIFVSAVLMFLLILREAGITKKLSPMKASHYVSLITIFLLLYVLLSFIAAIFAPTIFARELFILFGFCPFIIGKLVTYKKVKLYSTIQIVCVILSLIYSITL